MIRVEGLNKSFDGREVFSSLSLEVLDRERVAILGRTGSGKTVLLKCLVGLIAPDSGRIWLDGVEVTRAGRGELLKLRRHVGFVFQGNALLDSLTVADNIGLTLSEVGMAQAEREAVIQEKIALVGLDLDLARLYPAQLSGGMQKQVAIARALALNPSCLFYDEPTTGLDPMMRERVVELILNIAQGMGVTSVIVSHDLYLARKVSTRLYFLKDHKVLSPSSEMRLEDFYG
jgi:phospholipid/cholesterol/gamma-HCH transport system ATP-binding protein